MRVNAISMSTAMATGVAHASVQPFVTIGGGALPLPTPAQPATLTATSVASNANASFFIAAP
jgi:hypothetical protein